MKEQMTEGILTLFLLTFIVSFMAVITFTPIILPIVLGILVHPGFYALFALLIPDVLMWYFLLTMKERI